MTQQNLFDDVINATPEQVLANMDAPDVREHWPQLLVECVDEVAARLERGGYTRDEARYLSIEAVAAISELCSGSNVYWPKLDRVERILRDKQIWNQFDGSNVDALVRRYKLTTMQIYNILREQRALHIKRVQPDLFVCGDSKD